MSSDDLGQLHCVQVTPALSLASSMAYVTLWDIISAPFWASHLSPSLINGLPIATKTSACGNWHLALYMDYLVMGMGHDMTMTPSHATKWKCHTALAFFRQRNQGQWAVFICAAFHIFWLTLEPQLSIFDFFFATSPLLYRNAWSKAQHLGVEAFCFNVCLWLRRAPSCKMLSVHDSCCPQ